MKNNYEIKGMSCGGCVTSVKEALMKVSNVEDVELQLHPPVAAITMSKDVDITLLQKQLSDTGHYSITKL